jgi:LPS-assembly protein
MIRSFLILLLTLLPVILRAQDTPAPAALLIADELYITQDRQLVASGNVEAFQGTTRIRAKEIRYDQATGALTIVGPITLRDGEDITILANAAELSPDLQSGLLTGARMVLDEQLQLAAVQVERVDERYSQLYKTAATSCKVCDDGRPPLWQIRAKRVIYDKEERQLYFDQAQFRIRSVPVFYIPRLRLPDPTLDRATGFLIPELRSTSELNTGIKIPYFIKLGDHRDLTVTPYLSPRTRTVELRYRQAFTNGKIKFEGAISDDEERPGDTRAYLFAEGIFSLPNDFVLGFDVELTSDDSYLRDYDYSDKDRLDSTLAISRVKRDEYIEGAITFYESLREDEDNDTQPTFVGDALYEARYFPDLTGGELRVSANIHNHYRTSDLDILGRDVFRLNLDADWLRTWTLPGGLVVQSTLGASADNFDIKQDSTTNPQNQTQAQPRSAVTLRYPMTRNLGNGVTQYLEPIAQVGWSGGSRLNIPNEESTRVEFDGGNLLSLSRFPEADRRERGLVSAFGVNWSHVNPLGWDASLTLGQVIRDTPDADFTESSGLNSTSSNVLLAGQVKYLNGLAFTARSLFKGDLDFSKVEIRGDYIAKRVALGGTYVFVIKDADENRADNIEEIALYGSYKVDARWRAIADWRFDLEESRAAEVGVGLSYNNECVDVNLEVNRRYTNSSSLEPSTSLGFTIGLRGFSAQKGTETYSRTCG